MGLEEFIIAFVIFTIIHPIIDFGCPLRQWQGEYWFVINPLHAMWDSSSFRTHPQFYKSGSDNNQAWLTEEKQFWRHLSKDQTAHVFLNLIAAFFIAFFPIAIYICVVWVSIGMIIIFYTFVNS